MAILFFEIYAPTRRSDVEVFAFSNSSMKSLQKSLANALSYTSIKSVIVNILYLVMVMLLTRGLSVDYTNNTPAPALS